jgi:hypothetical protein
MHLHSHLRTFVSIRSGTRCETIHAFKNSQPANREPAVGIEVMFG